MTHLEIKVNGEPGQYRVVAIIKDAAGELVLKRLHPAASAETAGAVVSALLLAKEAADEERTRTEHVH